MAMYGIAVDVGRPMTEEQIQAAAELLVARMEYEMALGTEDFAYYRDQWFAAMRRYHALR